MISQYWFRWWLGAVRQLVITWGIVDPDMSPYGVNKPGWVLNQQYFHHYHICVNLIITGSVNGLLPARCKADNIASGDIADDKWHLCVDRTAIGLCCMTVIYLGEILTWWRHQIRTFSALLDLCEGNPPATPFTKASDTELWCFMHLNRRLS